METGIERPGVQGFVGGDPQRRRDEGLVGDRRRVRAGTHLVVTGSQGIDGYLAWIESGS